MQPSFDDMMKFELQKLYNVEMQLVDGLKMLAAMAENPDLKQGLEDHLVETKTHASRIMQICDMKGWSPVGIPSKTMKAMQMETLESLNGAAPSAVTDAMIITAAQKSEHFEIASYGTAAALANQMGYTQAAELLATTLEEEKAADEKLTKIAEGKINAEAVAPTQSATAM